MKLSDIASLMTDAADVRAFQAANAKDFEERLPLLEKRGSVIPVRVVEDRDIAVTTAGVSALCRHFIAGNLGPLELAYVADALQLADRVEWSDEVVSEYVAEFTDPEINGPFTVERAREIVREIAQHT
jgi:hypothetical protein